MAEPDAIVPAQGQPTHNDPSRKDSTPPDGTMVTKKRFKIELRVEITSKTVNVYAATRKTVQALMEADPTIQILSTNQDSCITAKSDIPIDTKNFKKFFPYEKDTRKNSTKVSIGMTIIAGATLEQLKQANNRELVTTLQENKLWMVLHKFHTLKLTTVGFFTKKHHSLTYRPYFEQELYEDLQTSTNNPEGRNVVPDFEIVKNQVRFYADKNKYSANVLEIRCEKDSASLLSQILCDADLDVQAFGTYCPYGMQEKDIYPRLALAQNVWEHNIRTITLLGVPRGAMYSRFKEGSREKGYDSDYSLQCCITECATAENGNYAVIGVEETMDTDSKGKWFIVVEGEENLAKVQKYVDEQLIIDYENCARYEEVKDTFTLPPRRGDYRKSVEKYGAGFSLNDLPEIITTEPHTINGNRHRQAKRTKRDYVVFDTASTELYPPKSTVMHNQNKNWAQVAKMPQSKSKRKSEEGTTATATETETSTQRDEISQGEDTVTQLTLDASQQLQNIQEAFEQKLALRDAVHRSEMEKRDARMKKLEERVDQTSKDIDKQITLLHTLLANHDKEAEANQITIQITIKETMESQMEKMVEKMAIMLQPPQPPNDAVTETVSKELSYKSPTRKKPRGREDGIDAAAKSAEFAGVSEFADHDKGKQITPGDEMDVTHET